MRTISMLDSPLSQYVWPPEHPSVVHVARETQTSSRTVAIFFGTLGVHGKDPHHAPPERYWIFSVGYGARAKTKLVLVSDSRKNDVAGQGKFVRMKKMASHLRNVILQHEDPSVISTKDLPHFEKVSREKRGRNGWKRPPFRGRLSVAVR